MTKLFVFYFSVVSHLFAQDLSELIQSEIAKNNDSLVDSVSNVATVHSPKQIRLSFTLEVGEGGLEECQNIYQSGGQLMESKCVLDYITHSMGTENKRTHIMITRKYNEKSELQILDGSIKIENIKTKKIIEDRKISSKTDPSLELLSRPLLKLNDQILRAFPKFPDKKKATHSH